MTDFAVAGNCGGLGASGLTAIEAAASAETACRLINDHRANAPNPPPCAAENRGATAPIQSAEILRRDGNCNDPFHGLFQSTYKNSLEHITA